MADASGCGIASRFKGSSKRRRVLVLRHDGLGDWLLWLDAARRIREALPPELFEISLLGSEGMAEINELCPFWDRSFARTSSSPVMRLPNLLRKLLAVARADVLVNPVPNGCAAGIARFSFASERVCMDFSSVDFMGLSASERKWMLSLYTTHVPAKQGEHLIEIAGRFADAICGSSAPRSLPELSFVPERKPPFENYLLVAPGSNGQRRRWESEKMAAVVDLALDRLGFDRAVFCGSQADCGAVAEILGFVKRKDRVADLCGRTGMLELFGLVKHARAALCNDSGPGHLAASYGVPSACVLGGGHFGFYHPYPEALLPASRSVAAFVKMDCYNCNWHCSVEPSGQRPFPCLRKIEVEQVFDALKKALGAL